MSCDSTHYIIFRIISEFRILRQPQNAESIVYLRAIPGKSVTVTRGLNFFRGTT